MRKASRGTIGGRSRTWSTGRFRAVGATTRSTLWARWPWSRATMRRPGPIGRSAFRSIRLTALPAPGSACPIPIWTWRAFAPGSCWLRSWRGRSRGPRRSWPRCRDCTRKLGDGLAVGRWSTWRGFRRCFPRRPAGPISRQTRIGPRLAGRRCGARSPRGPLIRRRWPGAFRCVRRCRRARRFGARGLPRVAWRRMPGRR